MGNTEMIDTTQQAKESVVADRQTSTIAMTDAGAVVADRQTSAITMADVGDVREIEAANELEFQQRRKVTI